MKTKRTKHLLHQYQRSTTDATWTWTKNDGMVMVESAVDNFLCTLVCPHSYWWRLEGKWENKCRYLTDCLWRCLFTRMLCDVCWHCPHVPTPTLHTGDNRQRNLTPHLSAAASRLLIMNSFIICCSQHLCTNAHGQYWRVCCIYVYVPAFFHQSIIEELLNMSHKIVVSTIDYKNRNKYTF